MISKELAALDAALERARTHTNTHISKEPYKISKETYKHSKELYMLTQELAALDAALERASLNTCERVCVCEGTSVCV